MQRTRRAVGDPARWFAEHSPTARQRYFQYQQTDLRLLQRRRAFERSIKQTAPHNGSHGRSAEGRLQVNKANTCL